MGHKRRAPKDKMVICFCVSRQHFPEGHPKLEDAAEWAPENCTRCQGTGKVRKRTGKAVVVWEGNDGRPLRAVLVDADTVFALPCKVVIERGTKNATGRLSWREMSNTTNLEKQLAYELGAALGKLPYWAEEDV